MIKKTTLKLFSTHKLVRQRKAPYIYRPREGHSHPFLLSTDKNTAYDLLTLRCQRDISVIIPALSANTSKGVNREERIIISYTSAQQPAIVEPSTLVIGVGEESIPYKLIFWEEKREEVRSSGEERENCVQVLS